MALLCSILQITNYKYLLSFILEVAQFLTLTQDSLHNWIRYLRLQLMLREEVISSFSTYLGKFNINPKKNLRYQRIQFCPGESRSG